MPETVNTGSSVNAGPHTFEELSKAIELPLTAPELTEEAIAAGCALAKRYGLAAVIVRPADLDQAERWMAPAVALGAAVDWPHGYSTTAVKHYAVRDALRRGAREITIPMNGGKLLSRQFQYLEMELLQIVEACSEVHALLTVHLDTGYLTEEHKIVACRVVKRAGADFIACPDARDIPLLREYTRDRAQLKMQGVATLDAALDALALGCARVETANAADILELWKARLAASERDA